MITRETRMLIKYTGWEVAFTVHDNEKWTVSLSNRGLKTGATSDFCQQNWNKGLAEVFTSVADLIDFFDAIDLVNSLDRDDRIDSAFTRYLPPNWQQCLTRQYEDAYDAWEATWIDGPQP